MEVPLFFLIRRISETTVGGIASVGRLKPFLMREGGVYGKVPIVKVAASTYNRQTVHVWTTSV